MIQTRNSRPHEPEIAEAVDYVLTEQRRILIIGEPGVGKSTLAAELALKLGRVGRSCWAIDADPGSPTFGLPGTACCGKWEAGRWDLADWEALCTLDAGRFRLPLVSAVRTLTDRVKTGTLLVDAPGVVRGVAGAELFTGLVEAAEIDLILMLVRHGRLPLPNELDTIGVEIFPVQASSFAKAISKRQRARQRTKLWDAYLDEAEDYWISLTDLSLVGTPPPVDVDSAWIGRQVALGGEASAWQMGEAVAKDANNIRVRLPRAQDGSNILVVRDAQRGEGGWLNTAKPFAGAVRYFPSPDVGPYQGQVGAGPRPVARVGNAIATLVNGIFGDPLLHLRLRHQRRSVLFDLGDGARLPARIAHQITDVFISHAHIDHIGGFLWLLRSRIGEFLPCRVFGPPGLSEHIRGLVSGILWDRIGETGPRFEIAEFQDTRLDFFAVQAGRPGIESLGSKSTNEGVIMEEPMHRVRAVTLDHRTPVVAFAFEQAMQLNIRKDRLKTKNLPAGPWLTELKQHIAAGESDAPILLPNGAVEPAGALAGDLVLITPGQKLVYATDFANTEENKNRLMDLALRAHTLFCEAPFIEQDVDRASKTGHLTARACGEIAMAADVEHLVPFHFSRRYENEPERVYEEVRAVCSRVVVPRPV